MEFYQLRTFTVVAEEGSIARASKRLFTTPPAISAQIKALEEEFGIPLFVRTSRGMALTEKGSLLRTKALATLAAAQDLANHAKELRNDLVGNVRLGLNAPINSLRVPRVLERLRAAAPGIGLELVQSSSGEIIEKLEAEELDMGFLFGDPPEGSLIAHALGSLRLVVAIPAGWSIDPERGAWEELAQLPWIYSDKYCPFQTMADRLFARQGLECKRVAATNDESAKQALVAAGEGIAMLLEDEALPGAARGDLMVWRREPLMTELSLAYRSARSEEPLLRAVEVAVFDAWRPGERNRG
jgi:DNA-binding transcriptional LysR family regulator